MPLPLETGANRRAVNRALHALACIDASNTTFSVTGTTSETTLTSIVIPGGVMGPNGYVIITTFWAYTNSANVKTARIRAGNATTGTAFIEAGPTTTRQAHYVTRIRNANSQSSQKGSLTNNPGTTSLTAIPTSSINTASDWTIYITGQLANSGETLSLEGYQVEVAYLP